MLDDVYNSKILDFAGNIQRTGRLQSPHATAKKHSKLCGSTVLVDIRVSIKDDEIIVEDFSHEVKACALGQAAASIMARNIIGAKLKELKVLQKTMKAMLKENGEPPNGKFEEFKYLEPVRDYKARHASTMLTFDAVVDCLEQIEAREDYPGGEIIQSKNPAGS